jgi:DNA-binding transcriptional regulator YhcF (GntR family)
VPQQPMYLQIADDLRNRIELGATLPTDSGDTAAVEPDGQLPAALRPGSQLPTELGLSDAYSASRNTIRDAIKRLASMGLVETRQGQGTFVTQKIDPFCPPTRWRPRAPRVPPTCPTSPARTAGQRSPFPRWRSRRRPSRLADGSGFRRGHRW